MIKFYILPKSPLSSCDGVPSHSINFVWEFHSKHSFLQLTAKKFLLTEVWRGRAMTIETVHVGRPIFTTTRTFTAVTPGTPAIAASIVGSIPSVWRGSFTIVVELALAVVYCLCLCTFSAVYSVVHVCLWPSVFAVLSACMMNTMMNTRTQ